jgi:hypothetical protein
MSSRSTSGAASGKRNPNPVAPSAPRFTVDAVQTRPRSTNIAPWTPGNRAAPKGNPIIRKSVSGNRHSRFASHARVPTT